MLFKIILNIISNWSIEPIDGALTGTTTPDKKEPERKGNKRWIITEFNLVPY